MGERVVSVVVVGRGPSLGGKARGEDLDDHDLVVRTTNGRYGRDHGTRVDYVLANLYEVCFLCDLSLNTVRAVWFYRTRARKPIADWTIFDDIIREGTGYRGEVVHINEGIEPWLSHYELTARPVNQRAHPHVTYPSKGTAAALMALEALRPARLVLAGLDNVVAGSRTNHCHDFSAELATLMTAADAYGTTLEEFHA